MQELIDRLVKEANVTPEQAKQSIETICCFCERKIPNARRCCQSNF